MVPLLLLLLLLAGPVQAEKLTLNLKGADISALIETVSEATGKNFILDPKVQGKVTVISTRPMDADELYKTFLSILEVHGFIAVPSGHVIKIIPNNTLKYRGVLADSEGKTMAIDEKTMADDEIIIQVYALEHVEATRLIPTLRPLVSPKGHLAAHSDGNMLVVSDYAKTVKRLGHIIRRVDKPITSTIEMVRLEHASARELAKLINSLGKSASFKRPGKRDLKPLAVADERTNRLLIGGDKQIRTRLRAIIAHLDTPVVISGNTRVVHLRFAKAKELASVLTSMGENFIKKNKKTTPTGGGIVNVQVYKDSNALVLTAPATLLKTMEDVILRLDVRRAQVQVEAIIADIKTDLASELGVEWGVLAGKDGENRGIVSGTNFPSGSGHPGLFGLGGAALADGAEAEAMVASSMTSMTGMVLGGTNMKNLAGLLRAIKSDTSNNVLSTPSLVTLDNEEAEIVVGKEVPFVTGSYSSTGTGGSSIGNPFQTVNRKNVGLTLRVTPQINEGDTIHLELVQEASALEDSASTGAIGMMTTNTRTIKTTVLVDNGQILVLGGLISNNVQQSVSKVPLLGDIPFLGTLFRAERKTNRKTNLMVFLRPTILRTPEDGFALTHRKYRAIRDQQLAVPEHWNPVFWGSQTPILPEIADFLKVVPEASRLGDKTRMETSGERLTLEERLLGRPTIANPGQSSGQSSGDKQDALYEEEEDYVR